MPVYRYKAATPGGEIAEGEIDAVDLAQAVARIQAEGNVPIRIRPAGRRWGGFGGARGVRGREIQGFTQELATLLSAGLPLDRSLQVLMDIADDPKVTRMISGLLDRVRAGSSLSDALEAQTGTFSRFYVNMVRAGEAGGALHEVLSRLSEYLTRARELRDSVVSALIYPGILLSVSVVSVMVLMIFVVPNFTQLFEDSGRALPVLTQVVVGSAEWLAGYWWLLLLGILSLLLLLRRALENPEARTRWDGWVLRIPLVGDLVRKVEAARFMRGLGTLLGNGVPLLAALSIVRETLSNRALATGLNSTVEGLKAGQSMSEPLLAADIFPRLGLQMIKVGEETGRLEPMLLQVADLYDREVRTTVQRMLALLEPVLIVTLGLVIAVIIISILIALVSVNELAF